MSYGAICLLPSYAMSGTEIAHAGTALAYAATRRAVLRKGMVLRADLPASADLLFLEGYHPPMLLRAPYAMSGTDLRCLLCYAPTRFPRDGRLY
eukprot:3940370-Rhodomonas_salina.1